MPARPAFFDFLQHRDGWTHITEGVDPNDKIAHIFRYAGDEWAIRCATPHYRESLCWRTIADAEGVKVLDVKDDYREWREQLSNEEG